MIPGFALASVFLTSLALAANVSARDWFDMLAALVLMDGSNAINDAI